MSCCNSGEGLIPMRFKTGYVAGYLSAIAMCFGVLVKLAYSPPSKWWPK